MESQKTGEESSTERRGCSTQIKCGEHWEVPDFSNLRLVGAPGKTG